MDQPLLPAALAARFRPQRVLGEGGFGRVILARDQELQRPVAVKVLDISLADPEVRARFLQEARVTAELRHPAIVPVFEHGVADGKSPYIVYGYVEGETLHAKIERKEVPASENLHRWATDVAEALACAHDAGVLHRDVKPENVMVTPAGRAVLCDFGIALCQTRRASGVKTRTGVILGTPAYLAPELWNSTRATPASDQFSWGATFFHLVFGIPPFGGSAPMDVLRFLDTGSLATGPQEFGRKPNAFDRVLLRALEREPGKRHASMRAVAAAVAGADADPGLPPTRGAPVVEDPRAGTLAAEKVEGPARPAPAGRSLGARLAVAWGAVLVVGGLLLATRGPPPAPPPAPAPLAAEPPPPPRPAGPPADVVLEEAYGRLADLVDTRDVHTEWQSFSAPRMTGLGVLSDELPAAWGEFLDALVAWIVAERARDGFHASTDRPDPQAAELLLARYLVPAVTTLETLRLKNTDLLALLRPDLIDDPGEILEARAALAPAARRFLATLEAGAPRLSLAEEVFALYLEASFGFPGVATRLELLSSRLVQGPPLERLSQVFYRTAHVLMSEFAVPVLGCGPRARVWRRVVAYLLRGAPGLPGIRRHQQAHRFLAAGLDILATGCPLDERGADVAALEALVKVLRDELGTYEGRDSNLHRNRDLRASRRLVDATPEETRAALAGVRAGIAEILGG